MVKNGKIRLHDGKINAAEADLELKSLQDPSRELALDDVEDSDNNIYINELPRLDEQGNSPSFRNSKEKEAEYKAELLKMRYQKEAGELVAVSDVKNELQSVFLELRQKLENLGSRASGKLVTLKTEREIAYYLEEAVNGILNEVADSLVGKRKTD